MAEKHEQSEYGYPNPGPQHVSVDKVMTDLYFMSDREWNADRSTGAFDYVIIGSSFCALGFTKQMLDKKPDAKILIIERGMYFHPEHFQNLPPAYALTVGGKSETFHWDITDKTHEGEYIKWQHGMNNFFGGRSSFWSAWCPKPTKEEMSGWPQEVIDKVFEYFPAAKKLLNVIPSNKISLKERKSTAIFGALQEELYTLLKSAPSDIPAITRVDYAPLAVRADMYR